MSHPNEHDIKVLNGLIASARDSAEAYSDAAGETAEPAYRELFEKKSFERRTLATELQHSLLGLGGESDAESSILTKARRALGDIKHALLRDEATVVSSVEESEDRAKARFEKALNDDAISATTRETVRRAHAEVKAAHDEMSDLKHSLEGRRDADSRLFPQ